MSIFGKDTKKKESGKQVKKKRPSLQVGAVEVFCSCRGAVVSKEIWVGNHSPSLHPIFFQNNYFEKQDVMIPEEMKKAFADLSQVAVESNIPYYQVVLHAFAVAKSQNNQ